eukprot:6111724-Pyramimonas_sp.AAC.1
MLARRLRLKLQAPTCSGTVRPIFSGKLQANLLRQCQTARTARTRLISSTCFISFLRAATRRWSARRTLSTALTLRGSGRAISGKGFGRR